MIKNMKEKLLLYKVPHFILGTSAVLICFYFFFTYILKNIITDRFFIFHFDKILLWSMFLIFCVSIYFFYP